jgi:hypothetical protein
MKGARRWTTPSVSFGVPGPADDVVVHFATDGVPKLPKWIVSNTLTYRWHDFALNLRHRAMTKRYLLTAAGDPRYLPQNSNLDAGMQYKRKNVLLTRRAQCDEPELHHGHRHVAAHIGVGGQWFNRQHGRRDQDRHLQPVAQFGHIREDQCLAVLLADREIRF